MQPIFIAVAVAATLLLVLPRRRFDLLTLGSASSLLYFLPGVVGFDIFETPLEPRVYAVFILVLAGLGIAVWVRGTVPPHPPFRPQVRGDELLPLVATSVAVAIVAVIMLRYGMSRLVLPARLSGIPSYLYVTWRVTASLALVYAFLARSRRLTIISALLLGLTFMARDRTALVLAVLAVLVEWYRRKGPVSLLAASRRIALPVLLFMALMGTAKLWFQGIYLMKVKGRSPVEAVQVFDSRTLRKRVLTNMEPLITQSILNEVFRQDFRTGPDHLVGVVYQAWPAPAQFGHPSGVFNDLYQAELFPSRTLSTMAYNFWAEAIAAGGWLLLVLYICIYVGGLAFFDRLSRSPRLAWRGLGLLMGSYWAFYIHRNSLANIIAYERQVLYMAVIVILLASAIPLARRARGRVAAPAPGEPVATPAA